MLIVEGLKISISRGDTGTITVTFTGQDVPPDGTIAQVCMQQTQDSEEPLWEKNLTVSSGRVTIPLMKENSEYPRGKYVWVLRLLYANGDRYTPMEKPQEFVILPAGAGSGDADG